MAHMGPIVVTTLTGLTAPMIQETTFPTTKAASLALGVPTNILSAIRLMKTGKTYPSRLGEIVFIATV